MVEIYAFVAFGVYISIKVGKYICHCGEIYVSRWTNSRTKQLAKEKFCGLRWECGGKVGQGRSETWTINPIPPPDLPDQALHPADKKN